MRGREGRGPAVFLANAALLTLLLAGAALSVQSAYALEAGRAALVGTAVGLGLGLAGIYALPRFRWLALLLLAEGYALGIWLLWDRLGRGGEAIRLQLGEALGGRAALPALHSGEETLFLAAALILLALPLGWAVLRQGSFWTALALTLPLLIPAFLFNRLPDWPDFLLLLTGWGTLLLTGLCRRGGAEASARLTLAALPAVGMALVLLTLALPQAGYVYPQWAQTARNTLLAGDASLVLPEFLAGGLQIGGSGARVDLASAGPLSLSDRTVLRVETDVPGRLYLRGMSAGVYTGAAWEPLEADDYEELGDLGGYAPLNFPALTAPAEGWHAVMVEQRGAPGGCFYVPYYLLTNADELGGGSFVNDSHVARHFGVDSYTVYYRPEAGPTPWTQPLTGAAARAEEDYRDFVYEHYLTVPEEVVQALRTWAERAQDLSFGLEDSFYQTAPEHYWAQLGAARLIPFFLAATTVYDTEAPAMPEGADFVDHFLNQSRRGYCMHYATAAALYFRYLGIPARYVSGYVVTMPQSGQVNVPESAAHAWVEIYLDGYGWYPVEVTPADFGEDGETRDETPAESAAPAPSPTPSPTPEASAPAAPAQTVPVQSRPPEEGGGASGGPEAGAVGGGLSWLALLAALWLFIFARRRLTALLWRRRLTGPDTNAAALWAYRLQERLRPWGGRPIPRVEELALKARFSQHTLTETERQTAVAAVRTEEQRVEAALPRWKALMFRWLWCGPRAAKTDLIK